MPESPVFEKGRRNDGWTDLSYRIVEDDDELNKKIGAIVNEAWHVHRHHRADWKRGAYSTKDHFARELGALLAENPGLERRCLAVGDRVLSMLVYRLRELREEARRQEDRSG